VSVRLGCLCAQLLQQEIIDETDLYVDNMQVRGSAAPAAAADVIKLLLQPLFSIHFNAAPTPGLTAAPASMCYPHHVPPVNHSSSQREQSVTIVHSQTAACPLSCNLLLPAVCCSFCR
jgi:hypothetical protein